MTIFRSDTDPHLQDFTVHLQLRHTLTNAHTHSHRIEMKPQTSAAYDNMALPIRHLHPCNISHTLVFTPFNCLPQSISFLFSKTHYQLVTHHWHKTDVSPFPSSSFYLFLPLSLSILAPNLHSPPVLGATFFFRPLSIVQCCEKIFAPCRRFFFLLFILLLCYVTRKCFRYANQI